jgi:hypothetical protein
MMEDCFAALRLAMTVLPGGPVKVKVKVKVKVTEIINK